MQCCKVTVDEEGRKIVDLVQNLWNELERNRVAARVDKVRLEVASKMACRAVPNARGGGIGVAFLVELNAVRFVDRGQWCDVHDG